MKTRERKIEKTSDIAVEARVVGQSTDETRSEDALRTGAQGAGSLKGKPKPRPGPPMPEESPISGRMSRQKLAPASSVSPLNSGHSGQAEKQS